LSPPTQRTFDRFDDALNEVIDARVWVGIHWRSSDVDGALPPRDTHFRSARDLRQRCSSVPDTSRRATSLRRLGGAKVIARECLSPQRQLGIAHSRGGGKRR
jgi:hypothetical protein